MEIASYFFCRCVDLYLKNNGIIGFLLPISTIIGYNQHVLFREFKKPVAKLLEIHNFSKVRPIFSLPTVCLIAKKGESTTYPVSEVNYKAVINKDNKNCQLEDILGQLEENKSVKQYIPPKLPERFSEYYNDSFVGASLFPQPFWYISFDTTSNLPISREQPRVKTNNDLLTKKNWRGIVLEGVIESDFIFSTLLGKDLLPFGIVDYRPVLLPLIIDKKNKRNSVIEITDITYPLLHNWVEKAQKIWIKKRTKKSEKNFPTVIERINYQKMLEKMPLCSNYIVIWNARGADSFAFVLNTNEIPEFKINENLQIKPTHFVPDITLYCYSTDSENKAHYLCAILNSPLIHKAVKPFQPKGNYGYRDIGNRPLMMNIPIFKNTNKDHIALCELSKICHAKVKSIEFSPSDSFKRRRNLIKKELASDYEKINELVSKITGIDIQIIKELIEEENVEENLSEISEEETEDEEVDESDEDNLE